MRRFLSIVMASVLMMLTLSIGLTAMAEKVTTNTGSQSFSVSFAVSEGDTVFLVPTYDIDVTVTNDLKFTYVKKYKQRWDTTNHEIETVESGSGWNNTEETLKIINNSNVGVKIVAIYGGMEKNGVSVAFSNEARGKWLNPGEEHSSTITVSGVPTGDGDIVGSVAVQIS